MQYLILISLFLAFGCSKIEIGLNLAPRVATNKIDDAFDFDSDKLIQIRKQIDSDIQNAKKELAQKIISHLDALQKHADDVDLQLEQIISFFDELVDTQTTLLDSFKNSAQVVFKNLSEREIKNFKKYSDEKYEQELEFTKNKDAFLKKKKQTFIKNYKLFLGNLSSTQEELLTDFINKNYDYFVERIKSRQKFSEELYLKIKTKDPVLDFFLSHYSGKKFADVADPATKEYLKSFFLMQITFWKNTNPKQKDHLKKTLLNYKKQLQKIASS